MLGKLIQGINDLETVNPELAKEWDYEKNGDLKPVDVTLGSGKKVWWVCPKGHSFTNTISNRTSLNQGCPICSGRKALAGFNDLATLNPELAKEWDYEKNGDLKPTEVTTGSSSKKIMWRCPEGHSFASTISNRKTSGCPICSNRQTLIGYNDLATTNPELAKEWDYQKNGDLKPINITAGSNKKIWWICPEGHSYSSCVVDRSQKHYNCPFCSNQKILAGFNDLATRNPEISMEWDYEKNGVLKPTEVASGSEIKVWWRCSKGHSYDCRISNRTILHTSCPFCSNQKVLIGFNDLATNNPEVLKEWDYERNKTIKPTDVTCGSNKKVWWRCSKGHSFYMTVNRHVKSECKCPYCCGKKILVGDNDLASTNSELLSEWDYEKNGYLEPSNVVAGSNKKAWWKCSVGHSYEMTISSKEKSGLNHCPYCTNRRILQGENDLATTHPHLLHE